MTLRTLIVDDEAPARARLRRLLAGAPDVTVIGEAANGEDAVRLIAELRPALLFLDVQMPPPDGLAVLRVVRDEWLPCTIFTTAHAEHAVAAFELHALDYLLKPFSAERLADALQRVRTRLAATPDASASDPRVAALVAAGPPAPLERILIKTGERYVVVRTADIEWIEAASNYVILHTPSGRHILRRSLSTLETELDARRFFRTSRSALVNLSAVREIHAAAAGEHVVLLQSGARLPLTRNLRDLQDRLQNPG
jgi:two-component system, LytTR family, response regulator